MKGQERVTLRMNETYSKKKMEPEIRLTIVGFVENQAMANTYGMIMQEVDGNRRFSIIIGEPEAQSITLRMKNKTLPRPLTHDLIKTILHTLKAELKKVVICDLINDIFHSDLHIEDSNGEMQIVDARTSDAVALAVWAGCPIYIRAGILQVVGTAVDSGEPEGEKQPEFHSPDDVEGASDDDLRLLGKDELSSLLEQAVEEERYELAAQLKKVLDKKNNHQI